MTDVSLPENVDAAIQRYANAIVFQDGVAEPLANLRRAITAALLRAEARGLSAITGRPVEEAGKLFRQAAALEAGEK